MLIAFLALIAMCNGILGWLHTLPMLGWLPAIAGTRFRHPVRAVAFILGRAVERLRSHRRPAGHTPGVE
jgi:nucleoside permease NupC